MMMNKFIFSFLLLIPFNAFAWSCLQQTPLGENELNVLQMASTKTQNFCLLLKKQDDGVTLKYQVQKIDILNNQNKKIVQSIGLKDTQVLPPETTTHWLKYIFEREKAIVTAILSSQRK